MNEATSNGHDGEATVDPKHNIKARKEIINEVVKELASLEADRKELGESIRAVKQKRIKGDLGMKIADFNAVVRLYNLEVKDRNLYLDTLRETFSALGLGEQLDFIGDGSLGNAEASAPPAAHDHHAPD